MRKCTRKLLCAASLAAASLGFVAPAGAFTIGEGQSGSIIWNWTNVDGADLSARVTFSIAAGGVSANTASFTVLVENLTAAGEPGQNVLTSFGVGALTPDATGASVENSNGGVLWEAALDADLTGNFKNLAICLYASNGCNGGAIGDGLGENLTDTFILNLTGTWADNASFTFGGPFGSKWQGVGLRGGSWELGGCESGDPACNPPPPDELPEPGTLALLGMGLLGIGSLRRRKA